LFISGRFYDLKLLIAIFSFALATNGSLWADAPSAAAQTNAPSEPSEDTQPQVWNWHVQNTDIVQYHPGFRSRYSGPFSLGSANEVKETVSLDLFLGLRLWPGAEFHLDGLMWQGFGLGNTRGFDGFPNGEAFRLGTEVPNINFPRVFLRQTIGLGGERETVGDDPFQLAGNRDASRLTLTLGRFSPKDIFDNNAYANDSRSQFMNWALMANEAWDYPGDALGYITGFAAELNQPNWAARYGFFQMPRVSNGTALDSHFLEAWGMVTELEKRYEIADHPGAVRLLAFLNHARMGSYEAAVENPARPADIVATRSYRYKYGFGLNLEQELAKNIGAFARLGWSDGENESWVFSDVDRSASLGLSFKGEAWNRTNDTLGLAGVLNGISRSHRDFFAAGGIGVLAGDGNLTYGMEEILETYYDLAICKTIHASLDYQFISHPAFNRDRGPVSVFGARLHWAF
jgi:high affinity Mn2+ porin